MKRILTVAILGIIFSGCTKNGIPEQNVEISFKAVVNIETKAAVTAIDNLEPIHIFRAPDHATDAVYTALTAPTITGTIDASGNVTPSTAQYYNANNTLNAWFTAFYPAATSISLGVATFTINGSQDLVWAPSVSAGSKDSPNAAFSFAFAHKLSKIRINVVAENELTVTHWGSVNSIKINAATSLDLDFDGAGAGVLTQNSTPVLTDLQTLNASDAAVSNVALTTSNQDMGSLMILPGTNITLKIATTAGNETVNIGTIEAGKAYTINLTFKLGGITFKATLADWADGGTAGHDVS
ncbi:MAG: fimbrillin family protein [Bacteroidales bacterium]|nr:fimbrillin family protein [Bacteroidales bacterium]